MQSLPEDAAYSFVIRENMIRERDRLLAAILLRLCILYISKNN
jgi:hypothetical protein